MSKTSEFQNHQKNHFSGFNIHGQGLVHFCDEKKLLYSRGKSLYRETEAGTEKIISLYDNFLEKWLGASGLFRRLSRSHIHHVLPVQTDKLVIFASKKLFYIDLREKKIITEKKISGSRPLCVTTFGDFLYYGQYTSNPERDPICLFRSKPPYTDWEIAKTFTDIRHIHGVFRDPFTETLWVTTGDRDHESRIIQLSEGNAEPQFSLGGSQMYRAVTLVFTEKYIYFGSDAPDQKNFIFRFKRGDSKAKKLTEVGGPIFYGCSLDDQLYFSTVCEPSNVNRTDAVELWHSSNGDEWSKVLEIKKDIWSMKYFQYGQIMFPGGPGDSEHLWLSTLGTVYDQKILKLKTDQILKHISPDQK